MNVRVLTELLCYMGVQLYMVRGSNIDAYTKANRKQLTHLFQTQSFVQLKLYYINHTDTGLVHTDIVLLFNKLKYQIFQTNSTVATYTFLL